jgi:large subunit ribosomal protein L4
MSSRNIPNIEVVSSWEFNVYDVLNYETLIITEEAIQHIEEVLING